MFTVPELDASSPRDSDPPDTESTYALIDCCVAKAVALFVPIASSSNTVVTLAPEPPSCNPDAVKSPIVPASTVTVMVPDPESATVTLLLFCFGTFFR